MTKIEQIAEDILSTLEKIEEYDLELEKGLLIEQIKEYIFGIVDSLEDFELLKVLIKSEDLNSFEEKCSEKLEGDYDEMLTDIKNQILGDYVLNI